MYEVCNKYALQKVEFFTLVLKSKTFLHSCCKSSTFQHCFQYKGLTILTSISIPSPLNEVNIYLCVKFLSIFHFEHLYFRLIYIITQRKIFRNFSLHLQQIDHIKCHPTSRPQLNQFVYRHHRIQRPTKTISPHSPQLCSHNLAIQKHKLKV